MFLIADHLQNLIVMYKSEKTRSMISSIFHNSINRETFSFYKKVNFMDIHSTNQFKNIQQIKEQKN